MPTQPANSPLTPKLVQKMIVNALSAFGISSKSKSPSPTWHLDSGVSNHMTSSSAHLSNLKQYIGDHHIQIADGGKISITAIRDVSRTRCWGRRSRGSLNVDAYFHSTYLK
eukprot:TRINITY_DN18286_c0_g1_i29.p2 TRINITY_DN18286_c0_g1~~TRINITY_DN18286_c0_g1_i29.p2  ORF type:complete len:111 (-),score=12.89 TRINITY_DN18286_c0_g1_i29:471-803(-)